MEHEVFVPVSPTRIGHALRDSALVTASLPGWQPDADAPAASEGPAAASGSTAGASKGAVGASEGAAGRLRLRVGGSTITYRGTVRVSGASSPFAVEASGTEVRGTGAVKATLEIAVAEATRPAPGALLTFRGAAQAEGRLASYETAVVEAAVRRLLDRFSADLAAHAPEEDAAGGVAGDAAEQGGPEEGGTEDGAAGPPVAAGETVTGEAVLDPRSGVAADDVAADGVTGDDVAGDDVTGEETPAEAADAAPEADAHADDTPQDPAEPEADVVDDLGEPAPPSDLDDFELVEVEVEVPESAAALDDLVPPAEAAHARRTMIGRSAEEVDHAPPRGRYAPVPAPDAASAAATLRWAAPAAAALVASAVVVGRVLRRRK
jgi:carbon monoxide dehydrogenase subunit G